MNKKKRYSYIKNPFSASGWYSFALGGIALIMTVIVAVNTVRMDGAASLFMAAMGLSAILLDITGIIFLMSSLREKDRNLIFAFLGGGMQFLVLLVWVIILAV